MCGFMNRRIKKILYLAGGIGVLGITGLAMASPITFNGVPVIGTTGQPLVQIVVGNNAKITDGIVAANIATIIGQLSYAQKQVTLAYNVSLPTAVSSSTTPKVSVSNVSVYLNESGVTGVSSSSVLFNTVIGSVINQAVLQNPGSAQYTKSLQGSGSYTFPESSDINSVPQSSPYTFIGVPLNQTVSANYNGGGVSFSGFSSTSNGNTYDNILNINMPGLLSNSGPTSETESLWMTGMTAFNQHDNALELENGNMAYKVVFGNPINILTNGQTTHETFSFLGTNYTTYNFTPPTGTVQSGQVVSGGAVSLAKEVLPSQIIYVGKSVNITGTNIAIELGDLSYANSNGVSSADIQILSNGQIVNQSAIAPGTIQKFNVSGQPIYVYVQKTFAGLYAYEKWAQVEAFVNVINATNGKQFGNYTNDNIELLWTTNATSSGAPNELQGIVLYGTSQADTNLKQGEYLAFPSINPQWKVYFEGQTLAPQSYDPISITTSEQNFVSYQNLAGNSNNYGVNDTVLKEPVNLFSVSSTIPDAFSFSGQKSSSVLYNLDSYIMTVNGNSMTPGILPASANSIEIVVTDTPVPSLVSPNNPLEIQINGYTTSNTPYQRTVTFNYLSGSNSTVIPGVVLNNVTDITAYLSNGEAYPYPGIRVNVYDYNGTSAGNSLATLSYAGPSIMYQEKGKNYYSLYSPSIVSYQQPNQPQMNFTLTALTPSGTGRHQYFTYQISEYPIPYSTSYTDNVIIGITNATSLTANPFYELNMTNGAENITYVSSSGSQFNVKPGFMTERGSIINTISPNQVTLSLAKNVDELMFAVTPYSQTLKKSYSQYGPYGIGEATNIPNVTIANVTYKINVEPMNVSAPSNSVSSITKTVEYNTTVPYISSDITTNPLVVLASNANTTKPLIVIGSGYVNSIAQQMQSQNNFVIGPTENNVTVKVFGNKILVAGFTANQTVEAGNMFIEDLLAQASS